MKETQSMNFDNQLNEEIAKRLNQMEDKDYNFAKCFTKRDYIFTGFVALVCFVMLILGAYL
jgi:hypothetical protein